MKTDIGENVIEIKIGDKLVDVSFKETRRLNILIANTVYRKISQFAKIPEIIFNIDLSGIYFIDSTGFQTLLSLLATAKKHGAQIIISNINNEVFELIRLLHLQNTFKDAIRESQIKCVA